MALSKDNNYSHEKDFDGESVAEKCGICKSFHVTPKSLICLHSFCLKCLAEKVTAGEDIITYPTCDRITELPNKGVEGLKTNFMLVEKHKRDLLDKQLKDKDSVIPCTSCEHDDSNTTAISFCRQCQEYMCEVAVKYHNGTRMTRGHEVISLEKLQTEGVPKGSDSDGQKVRMCPKHNDEKLKFYCETCEEPFCRDCEIIDHPRGENHAQVYLEDAIRKRSEEIQREAEKCKYVCQQFDDAIAEDERVEAAHAKAVEHTQDVFDQAAKEAQDKFSDNQTKHREKFTAELTGFDERRKQNIEGHKETLKKDWSRARSALDVARMLAETGTQYDVADMYKDVIAVLREFSDFTPVAERITEVTFKPNEDCLSVVESIPAPGTLKVGSLEWEQVREFGNGDLSGSHGLCFTSAGEIVVADYSAREAKLVNDQGTLSNTITQKTASFHYPYDVCHSSDGKVCMVDGSTTVKLITSEFKYNTTRGIPYDAHGIAVMKDGSLAISCRANRRIYPHVYVYSASGSPGGSRLRDIDITVMASFFIAITSKDEYVFSSESQKSVQVVNGKGQLIRCIGPPPDIHHDAWIPQGVACSKKDEVYVANRGDGAMGIYRFKISGEFVESVTTDLNKPYGLAMSEDGRQLAVVDNDGETLKVFGYKY